MVRAMTDFGEMKDLLHNTLSPYEEMVAYETLWAIRNESLRTIATVFKKYSLPPSEILQKKIGAEQVHNLRSQVTEYLKAKSGFSVSVHGAFQYPERLRSAKYPIELFYYKGDVGLLDSRCVSVVGTRKCSEHGKRQAAELVVGLVKNGFTIVSGLAAGIDTVALTTALESGGHTVGVLGTPIDEYYPRQNKPLQDRIASSQLLISQVPFFRYQAEPFTSRKNYFPQRNETMSALSEATIIVEASETSGTLTQARACLAQKRKLFILESCFENRQIAWPSVFEKRGAIRAKNVNDILKNLDHRR
jgi:DNA processing protein